MFPVIAIAVTVNLAEKFLKINMFLSNYNKIIASIKPIKRKGLIMTKRSYFPKK